MVNALPLTLRRVPLPTTISLPSDAPVSFASRSDTVASSKSATALDERAPTRSPHSSASNASSASCTLGPRVTTQVGAATKLHARCEQYSKGAACQHSCVLQQRQGLSTGLASSVSSSKTATQLCEMCGLYADGIQCEAWHTLLAKVKTACSSETPSSNRLCMSSANGASYITRVMSSMLWFSIRGTPAARLHTMLHALTAAFPCKGRT